MTFFPAKRGIKPLFLRFAAPVLAAYLLHWGLWELVFIAEQFVMSGLTKALNWVALLLGRFSCIEEMSVSTRFIPQYVVYGIIPLILGLLVGRCVLRRRRNTQQYPLQPS